jgi:hypothetical protein
MAISHRLFFGLIKPAAKGSSRKTADSRPVVVLAALGDFGDFPLCATLS